MSVQTNILWDNVKAAMEAEEFESDDEDNQVRRIFLGTVFSLAPSGKYYTPWACSNLNPCPTCGGRGEVTRKKYRLYRKLRGKLEETHRLCRKRWKDWSDKSATPLGKRLMKLNKRVGKFHCEVCNGCGSKEAYEDEQFWEKLTEEAAEHGYFIESGEGDPCDIFVAEVKDD